MGVRVSQVKPSNCQWFPNTETFRRLRFSSDADNVRLTNVCIIIIIIIIIIIEKIYGSVIFLNNPGSWQPVGVSKKIVLPSIFDTSLSSLTMWNLQSYPTTVLNKRMWFFLGGGRRGKTYSDPSYIFSGVKPPTPRIYALGLVCAADLLNWGKTLGGPVSSADVWVCTGLPDILNAIAQRCYSC